MSLRVTRRVDAVGGVQKKQYEELVGYAIRRLGGALMQCAKMR